jgi:peptidyl-prolyl cis-trans isomerase D
MALKDDLAPKRLASYLVILAIAFVFAIQWGPGSRGCESPLTPLAGSNAAAVVNGKEIPLRDYHITYTNQLRRLGANIPESQARALGIPQRVLNGMVDRELLAQEAERQGIRASDDEVKTMVRGNPDFQQDGKFSAARYKDVLRNYYRKTPQEYEAEIRQELAVEKMYLVIAGSAQVSDEEVKHQYFQEGNRAKLTYVRFLPSMYASKVPAPKPAELDAYRASHEKEISDHYTANAYVYQQPEKVRARHILIKVARDASPEQKDAARQKLLDIKKEIEGGKDFAEAATQHSDDVGSKAMGGDLGGFQTRQAWVPEFASAAFALKPGEISAPVETQYGVHLIKVEERKEAETTPLESVAPEIARTLWAKEKARGLAKAEAEKALAQARAGKKLEELFPAAKEKLQFEAESYPQATTSNEFNVTAEAISPLPPTPDLLKDIFALSGPAVLEKLYEVSDGYLVGKVESRTVPSEEGFTRDRESLTDQARRVKEREIYGQFLDALRKKAKISLNEKALNPEEPLEES